MFRFDKEQVVFDFAGVKMGGQPGEYPTVLAGTIFYGGHNIISDELTGDFDKSRAESLVNDMVEMSDVTGNPCIVQVFGQTEEAIVKYLKEKHGLLVGLRTAEDIKKTVGSAVMRDTDVTMNAKGRNVLSGLPKVVEITGNEICACFGELLDEIMTVAKSMFERTSPQLVADITNSSVLLTGGMSQLFGLDKLISQTLNLDVTIPVRANLCVSKGCELALKKMHILDGYGYSFKTKEEVRIR